MLYWAQIDPAGKTSPFKNVKALVLVEGVFTFSDSYSGVAVAPGKSVTLVTLWVPALTQVGVTGLPVLSLVTTARVAVVGNTGN